MLISARISNSTNLNLGNPNTLGEPPACGGEMQKLANDHGDHSDVPRSLRARTAAR